MTTDPLDIETKTRRFTLVDGVVLTLAIVALAAPFAARLQVQAHAAAPQVAVRADVSPIRPIDLDLGYEDQKAEAAFYEGLGKPPEPQADAPLDLALVAPKPAPPLAEENADHSERNAEPVAPPTTEPSVELDPKLPNFQRDVAVLFAPLSLDISIEADTSDEPRADDVKTVEAAPEEEEKQPEAEVAEEAEVATEAEAEEVAEAAEVAEEDSGAEDASTFRVAMTAPPTITPFPTKRPFHPVNRPITMIPLAKPEQPLPIDVTPPLRGEIEEAPLPPLEVATLPVPEASPELQIEPFREPISEPMPEQIFIEPLAAPTRPTVDTVALTPPPSSRIEIPPVPVVTTAPRVAVAAPPAPMPVVVPLETPPVAVLVAVATRAPAPAPARPVTKLTNGPRIALVIAAAGLNENVTRFAIDALPAGVTLAFAPVKADAGALAREAKQDGHTVLVEIPLEPVNKSRDPGPLTLRVADSPSENIDRLNQAFARIPVADGASSYLGARFNAEERAVGPVVDALAARNLVLFENEPTARSVFQDLSARAGLPYARGIIKFDRDRNTSAVREALDALEAQARARGSAIGVGTALRSTISTVALWVKEAEKRGVRLVPITQVAR